MDSALMFSHKSDHWNTPAALYGDLDKEFGFDFDPCPLQSEDLTCLLQPAWPGRRIFINPPYSNIEAFLNKARVEIGGGRCDLAVFLVPVRTDTRWFHDHVLGKAEIRFLRGRLKFGTAKTGAPFPSMVLVFRSGK